MPTYELECSGCGEKTTVFCSFKERDGRACEKCGAELQNVPAGFAVHGTDFEPHFDKGLGVFVKSPAHRRQVMKKQGVIEKY
jgi:putative FmdB family regulatory protein